MLGLEFAAGFRPGQMGQTSGSILLHPVQPRAGRPGSPPNHKLWSPTDEQDPIAAASEWSLEMTDLTQCEVPQSEDLP